jgi:hypothetical protein
MIKIFYNTDTGEILQKVSMNKDFEDNRPHINIDQNINVDHWRVDLETLTLVEVPEYQRPPSIMDRYR